MRTIELFSGTGSFSRVARSHGYHTFQTDKYDIDHQDLVADVRDVTAADFPYRPDILWASPPCEGFSVAVIGRNWNHDHTPKTDSARHAEDLVQHCLRLVRELRPTWWFIENPRGKLRKLPMMRCFDRRTVWYCRYGDKRAKPTDIWSNAHWWAPRAECFNGNPDCWHERAPRGAKSGTQGVRGYKERSRVPLGLIDEILTQHRLHIHRSTPMAAE